MPSTRGRRIHRPAAIVGALLCCALGLSACILTPADLTNIVAKKTTVGGVLEAGTATFDPDVPDFELYNICQNIAEVQWNGIGLKPAEELSPTIEPDEISCIFTPTDPNSHWVSMVEMHPDTPTYRWPDTGELGSIPKPPGSFFYEPDPTEEESTVCSIALDTNAGNLSVSLILSEEGKRVSPTDKRSVYAETTTIMEKVLAVTARKPDNNEHAAVRR